MQEGAVQRVCTHFFLRPEGIRLGPDDELPRQVRVRSPQGAMTHFKTRRFLPFGPDRLFFRPWLEEGKQVDGAGFQPLSSPIVNQ